METSLTTELLSKRRILQHLGATAHEIPYYQREELWLDAGGGEDAKGKPVSAFRAKIVKNRPQSNGRLERVRKIVCDFEERFDAKTCWCLLSRFGSKGGGPELAIIYVAEGERGKWEGEREALGSLRPNAFVCKLYDPQNYAFRRLKCEIEGGYIKAAPVLGERPRTSGELAG